MVERTATLTFIGKDSASGVVRKLDRAMDGLGGTAGKLGGALGSVAKIAAGALVVGIGAAVAGLGLAVKAAAEEEKGIARLNASLKANVKGFDGSTAAIEKAIKVGEAKAFSDDAQRASMALLVGATKDVGKAQTLMATAMDLARLKGISLEEASSALIKVEGGQFRSLKALGIVLKEGATATDALAAVQAVAAGQAEAYGKTTAGAFEAFNLAISNVVEDIGAFLLPMVTDLVKMLNEKVIPAARDIAAKFGEWVAANQPLIDQVTAFVSTTLADLVEFIFTKVVPAVADIAAKFGELAGEILERVIPQVAGIIGKFGELWGIITTKVVPVILDMVKRVWEGGLNKAVDAAYKVVGSVITVLTDLATWITSDKTIMDILKMAADALGTAFGLAADAVSFVVDFLGQLADNIRSNEAIMWVLARIGDAIAASFKAAAAIITGVIDAIKTAIKLADIFAGKSWTPAGPAPPPRYEDLPRGPSYPLKPPGRAAGGPVLSGRDYFVGERGPEVLRMGNTGGTIIPNAGGSGGPVIIQLRVDGRTLAEIVDRHLGYTYVSAARTSGVV